MQKVESYRRHAADCRLLAKNAKTAEHRAMLENMAATWDQLAEARAEHNARRERLASLETARNE